ncbi:unnamed protein product [Adineta ricciae]|uniref:Uncharacterized protein n=1 Tax=Adineta ricciae TaxID=249248 RepID=A0A815NA48_ADIRI|nr:unnamed protein product [Adineta ricciae]
MSTKSNGSNDLKYILLPTVETHRREPKFQPWYRERFKMKYPCHMNTKNWRFVKDGLDDFRDGLPPPHDDIMLEPEKGPGPVIFSQKRRVKASVCNPRSRLEGHQLFFSRMLPTVEKRRQLIDYYIANLLDRPMAFFPHFQQVLSAKMYEQIRSLLEGELSRVIEEEQEFFAVDSQDFFSPSTSLPATAFDNSDQGQTASKQPGEETNLGASEEVEVKKETRRPGLTTIVYDDSGKAWDSVEYEKKLKNPYRWFIENQKRMQTYKGPTREEIAVSTMESHLRKVAEHFCGWLYSLGGETNFDIDPAVVRNLFSTAYDTKPSLDVPIKLVQMTRLPVDLREGTKETMLVEPEERTPTFAKSYTSSKLSASKKLTSQSFDATQPRKYRYGAWYLPTNLWQRSLVTESLKDPKKLKAEREDATRIREEETNAYLAPMRGVDAFKDYLTDRKVPRLPKLITDVEQYRRDHPPEPSKPTIGIRRKDTS